MRDNQLSDFHGAAHLDVRDLCWAPRRGPSVVSGISFTAEPGEVLAIVGPNGAGKSSLLRCLYRYYRPAGGQVLLDGTDIWRITPAACARRVATVTQETTSDFSLSVRDIVELGTLPHVGWSRARRSGAVAHAIATMRLEPLLGRELGALSGGEKQRVMIARALAQDPALLILDEPTNHLDIRHQLEVLQLMRDLPCTVIVSLHDLALASAYADRVIVLREGRAASVGLPLEVLTPAEVRATFAVETAVDLHPVTGRPRFSFHLEKQS
ncbi:ABC transporter ATP-binding protein [Acidimangrovimonas sediminis]|uniref:ABC transporter ATP-binding protein n=1 Tax=Acidimangrovimonas sediminis TaxID=2056283 RepID=UPI000C8020B8|nr:ABC transporter ATP-binding protein [Acidimangrovimonas sediminis]